MHPFEQEANQIKSYLEEAHSKIDFILNPEITHLKLGIQLDLKKWINQLNMQMGIEPKIGHAAQSVTSGPLTKMFGKELKPSTAPVDVNKPNLDNPEDVALTELRIKRDELYPRFTGIASDQILDTISEDLIRGIAKKAGLPVTETMPKNINIGYIDEIKEAIRNSTPVDLELVNDNTNAFKEFISLESEEILKNKSEAEIKRIASLAGLPVSDTSPKKVDKKFVEHVRNAVTKTLEKNN